MDNVINHFKRGLFLMVLAFTVSSCASFPDGDYKDYSDIKAMGDKFSVGYNVDFAGSSGGAYGGSNEDNALKKEASFKATLEDTLLKSGYFDSVKEGPSKYHLSVAFETKGLSAAPLTGFFFIYSAGILPYYNNEELTVKIVVHEKSDGKMTTLKSYEYRRNVKTWGELFLIFTAHKHKPKDVKNDAVNDIFKNFVYDLSRDSIL